MTGVRRPTNFPFMSATYSHKPDGTLVLEIATDSRALLLTEAEVARRAGRSAECIRQRRLAGHIAPIAETPSGILLYPAHSVAIVARPAVASSITE